MTVAFGDLETLKAAEIVCDNLWQRIVHWGPFARDTVGKHLVEAADSIGANIAEAYARYHYGEKLTFLYYARGSLFETKYWINRAQVRELLEVDTAASYATELTEMARKLNALLAVARDQRPQDNPPKRAVHDVGASYDAADEKSSDLFSPADLTWLSSTL
jgi:four helix bundle protein